MLNYIILLPELKHNRLTLIFIIVRLIFILLFIPLTCANAQDDYNKWLQKDKKAFQDYQSDQDKQFVEMLKTGWIKTGTEKAAPLLNKPKPVRLPQASPSRIPVEKAPLKIDAVLPQKKTTEENEIPKNISETSKAAQHEADFNKENYTRQVSYEFFGSTVSMLSNPSIRTSPVRRLDSLSISKFFDEMSRSDYNGYISQFKAIKEKLKLNDWGYIQLVNEMSRHSGFSSQPEQMLFVWFILIKSGYYSKVSYSEDKVYLVFATKEPVFGTSFLRDGPGSEKKLYILIGSPDELANDGEVYCFNGTFPGADRPVELSIESLPALKMAEGKRNITFSIQGQKYLFMLPFNRSLIRYYEYYPQTAFGLYPRTTITPEADEVLLSQLKKYTEGKPRQEAMNFILHFVQYATGYKTDQEQFKREKPLFPEESLFYESSDCEDRSILFSYLVKRLFNEKVVLLDYPDHIASAVRMKEMIDGSYIELGKEKYFICDPTFLGANMGMCMPSYKNVKPNVISLE